MKTIYPDQSESYSHASEALEAAGYTYLGNAYTVSRNGNCSKTYKVFEGKKGGLYSFAGMSNFNTTIYEIYLTPMRSKELYYN